MTSIEPCAASNPALRRRTLLAAAGAAGAAAITLTPVEFASAAPGDSAARTITGHLDADAADFVYLPVTVPDGVASIAVDYTYDQPAVPSGSVGNACDIGMFDERGTRLGGRGFRGWSGGFRTSFSISESEATPGYLPGPVNAGTWYVILGPYTVAPQGLDYSVTVTLTYGAPGAPSTPNYPPLSAPGRGRSWYRGDCHLHTVYSDGKRQPSEVAAGARDRGLDFIVSTDHNTTSSHAVWGEYAGDDLLIILGEEVTTRNGHYLALGLPPGRWIDWRYRARDRKLDRFVDEIHAAKALFVPAHPYATCIACNWKFGYTNADAVEVWNGPYTADDEAVIATWDAFLVDSIRTGGRWLPAMGNSDAHSEPQVIGLPMNVVRAEGMNRDALLAGIAAGRTWICDDASVDLTFIASGGGRTAQIADRLPVPDGTNVTVRLETSGVPNGLVRLVTDQGELHRESLPASGSGTVTYQTSPQRAGYVRAEVRHPDASTFPPYGSMAALTNPIFLGGR
jgi:hypothetical protein